MQSIAESHGPVLRAQYLARSEKLSAELPAYGASDDHVHLAVRMALTRSIAEVVRAFKSESAVVLAVASGTLTFRWQSGYAAFGIDPNNTTRLFDSIERQREHHRTQASLAARKHIERDDESSA
ncbi:MAG: transposase [Myxococcales bacterium]|nr:transposase [Myxococcales bacterium]